MFTPVNPELGFTSDVIKDPSRFVGRTKLIQDCIRSLNSSMGLIAVYGKRGLGKSSLLRQIQQLALGDYTLAENAGLSEFIPSRPRRYLTVFYTCDSLIKDGVDLLSRLCNDQDPEDGLLRLVPNDGKELVEFSRAKEVSGGLDLKVANWGTKGVETSKYAKTVPGDVVQTFRNYISAITTHQVQKRMHRDSLLILLDEFDVIQNKEGLGSIIKSLSSDTVKFGICGIASDLGDLVEDHASVERLLEEGAVHVKRMSPEESKNIIYKAQELFHGQMYFSSDAIDEIISYSEGYPYLVQLFGKACVDMANKWQVSEVDKGTVRMVLSEIKSGEAFPTLEAAYQRAIGDSDERKLLLCLLAEQPEENTLFNDEVGRVVLRRTRNEAKDLDLKYIDQLVPRLIDKKYGPVLSRVEERQGLYEFVNPIFRTYVKLRNL